MNVYDSERMTEALAAAGFDPTSSAGDADLVILNTCHIREKAAEKVYSEVGRLKKLKEARAGEGRPLRLAVAGCVAQAEGEEMLRRAPVIDMLVGPQSYHRLPEMIAALDGGARPVETDFPAEDKFDHLPRGRAVRAATAFLTVQEGCDKFCTFCVVPYTRGAEASRPASAILAEARELVAGGVREITLLGQNVNAWRDDASGLAGLIERLAGLPGLDRIRYTTSHPRDMSDDLIAAHRDIPELMPFLHLPVQSGSDRILAAMNRRHRARDYLDILDRLRAARPDIAISGDFIVGFPGETEEDFEATLDLVRRVGHARAYSFKYSPRPGTPAADLPGQVPEPAKAERLARLQALLDEQQAAFNRATVGRTLEVVLDRPGRKPGQRIGRTPYMQSVHVDLDEQFVAVPPRGLDAAGDTPYIPLEGRGMAVTIVAAGPNSLEGRPAPAADKDERPGCTP